MRVLVLGSGAREHAIVHALRRSPGVSDVFAAPGNPGIAQAADLLSLSANDLPGVAEAAEDFRIDVTIVGPEVPLAMGVCDEFYRRGLRLFGPRRAAAELESSKVFAKEFCQRHDIPTAKATVVRTSDEAVAAARDLGMPVVFKADGLAAGKGVLMIRNDDDLDQAIDEFFNQRRFGDAGDRVLVEECLEGDEVSYMVISDGTRMVPVATSHDYKRAGENDEGPNTGGMGAHSPALVIPPGTSKLILESVVRPTIAGMAAEGREYRGVLYAGLMVTSDGPKVLEFNCRLGDPETQATFLRLDDNFAEIARDASEGALGIGGLNWRKEAVACVVLAAEGYPGNPRKGDEIAGINEAMALSGVTVYHAGTRLEDGCLTTSGGRVLSVCGRGPTLSDALDTAYEGVSKISFDGMWYRSDIGRDTLAKLGT
ncbi:MAG: phosphoribosylamine--glycine ligase [Acidobacteriota bacterium]|jgi:phosphoribosylamine--glycine ligase|nr:phosphoribosylamine--glycine ligase [Acidobacteriota bacterium]